MSGILWLASYPKSGNTWVRAFLANLFRDPDRPLPINELSDHALGDGFLVHYAQFTGRPADQISDLEGIRLRPMIHRWFAYTRGETVFVKTHSAVGTVDDVPLITPDATAGAIYVVRHPFDVAVSYAHHYRVELDQAVDALVREDNILPRSDKLLPQFIGSWAQNVNGWTTAPGMTRQVVRYEDMLDRPGETFDALMRFLGLPPDPARLRRAIGYSGFGELARQERAGGFIEARPDGTTWFFRSGRSGEGHRILNTDQKERLASALAPVMTRFGYDGQGRSTASWQATAP